MQPKTASRPYARAGQKGTVIVLTAAMTIFLTVVGIFAFHFARVLGGYRESTNAVDAGTINVAKRATEIGIDLKTPDEQQFGDLVDANGQITLRNINKVWGKALLASVNESAMEKLSNSTTSSYGHAQSLYTGAQSLYARLADKLNARASLQGFFNEAASANSVRLAGTDSVVSAKAGDGWQVAFVDSGKPSNIAVSPSQLPAGFDPSALQLVSAGSKTFLPGYTNIQVLGNSFPFVSFGTDLQPALIERSKFTAGTKPQWLSNPVPNAFSTEGQVQEATTHQLVSLAAYSQAQIGDGGSPLHIAHGWIRIRLHKNEVGVWVDGAKVYTGDYDYARNITFLPPMLRADIGNEISAPQPTVWDAMFVKPGDPGYDTVRADMLQRIREIRSDFADNQLEPLLRSRYVARHWSGPTQDFFIHANGQGQIVLEDEATARATTTWLASVMEDQADGVSAIPAAIEELGSGGNRADALSETQALAAPVMHAVVSSLSTTGAHYYAPCTGYDGMLGEFFLERKIHIDVVMVP
jgi:hypothetical protein